MPKNTKERTQINPINLSQCANNFKNQHKTIQTWNFHKGLEINQKL